MEQTMTQPAKPRNTTSLRNPLIRVVRPRYELGFEEPVAPQPVLAASAAA